MYSHLLDRVSDDVVHKTTNEIEEHDKMHKIAVLHVRCVHENCIENDEVHGQSIMNSNIIQHGFNSFLDISNSINHKIQTS